MWFKRLLAKGRAEGFNVNTNMHGEERAYVVTGEYDKVMPMDILPNQLIKSVLANDIDKMEELGIYEVVEEDLALCEFICTSKMPVQANIKRWAQLYSNRSVMKGLRSFLDRIKPTFQEGGNLSMLHSTFDAIETLLFVPGHSAPAKGAHIRDGIDLSEP